MKKEEFCEALGNINERYVEEARAGRKGKKPGWIKWGAMAACFAAVTALGAVMLQGGWIGEKTDTAALDNGEKIVFEKSEVTGSSIHMDGTMTTRRLTEEENAALFPGLPVTADAVFMADNMDTDDLQKRSGCEENTGNIKLIGLEGNIGNIKMIVTTSDVPLLDTEIVGTEESAEINGVNVVVGYFVTDPNSKGEQNAVYYAAFEIGDCKVYLENAGTKEESETTKNQLAEAVQKLTENGEPDFTSVIDNEAGSDLATEQVHTLPRAEKLRVELVAWGGDHFKAIVVDAEENNIFPAGAELSVVFDYETEILLDDGTLMVFNPDEPDTEIIGWEAGTVDSVEFLHYEEYREGDHFYNQLVASHVEAE